MRENDIVCTSFYRQNMTRRKRQKAPSTKMISDSFCCCCCCFVVNRISELIYMVNKRDDGYLWNFAFVLETIWFSYFIVGV